MREALAEFVSTRYYSSKLEFYLAVSLVPLCSCIAVATLLLSRSCFCSPLPSSLSFFFVRDARIYTLSRSSFTYARSLDSLRSSFSLCRLSRLQCALSFSLSSSSSLFSTFAPSVASPGSLMLSLSLSLYPPLDSFLTLQPAAFPAPVDSSSSRQPHRFSFCVLLSVCVESWMCVRVGALFPACTFHGPVPPARRFPGLVSSLVSSRSLSLSIHREPLVCHLSRSLLGRTIAVRVLL